MTGEHGFCPGKSDWGDEKRWLSLGKLNGIYRITYENGNLKTPYSKFYNQGFWLDKDYTIPSSEYCNCVGLWSYYIAVLWENSTGKTSVLTPGWQNNWWNNNHDPAQADSLEKLKTREGQYADYIFFNREIRLFYTHAGNNHSDMTGKGVTYSLQKIGHFCNDTIDQEFE